MLIPKEAEYLKGMTTPISRVTYYEVTKGVRLRGGILEATDNEALWRHTLQTLHEEFPATQGSEALPDDFTSIIPVKAFEKAMKNVPKKPSLSILNNIHVSMSDGKIKLTTTDLETTDSVEVKPFEGEFPDTDNVVKEFNKLVESQKSEKVAIGVPHLEKMLKVAKSQKSDYVELELAFSDEEDIAMIRVKISNPDVEGYVAPFFVDR